MDLKALNIVIIGAGNVAYQLGTALKKTDNRLLLIINRSAGSGVELAKELDCPYTSDLGGIPENADLVVIAVKDDAVEKVASKIRCKETVVAHTSGSIPLSILSICSDLTGVCYPLQTMHRNSVVNMAEVPFCIEGNVEKSENMLLGMARSISENVVAMNSEQRKLAHIAAVIACNFTNHFYALSEQILQQNGMDLDLLRPLIMRTASNVITQHPEAIQTGPARRNDEMVIQEHVHTLRKLSPDLARLYQEVSDSISRMYQAD